MSRIRTLYANEAILVGQNDAVTGRHDPASGDIQYLERVQSFDMSVAIPLEEINEFASLASIDRINLEGAEVSATLSYLLVDAQNETNLGLSTSTDFSVPALSGILTKNVSTERNYFKAVAPEGEDCAGQAPADVAVIGIGNGFLTSYSVEGSVGGYVTTNIGIQGSNARAYTDGLLEAVPSVDISGVAATGQFSLPTITPDANNDKASVLKVGDAIIRLYEAGTTTATTGIFAYNEDDITVQSFNVNVDLNREAIREVGANRPIAREITFPLQYSLQVDALAGDISADNIADYLCGGRDLDVMLTFKVGDCATQTGSVADERFAMKLKNVTLSSEDINTSIGPNSTVSMTFDGQIGGANDSDNGIFISGVTDY